MMYDKNDHETTVRRKNLMKKTMAFLLSLAVIFGLSGCTAGEVVETLETLEAVTSILTSEETPAPSSSDVLVEDVADPEEPSVEEPSADEPSADEGAFSESVYYLDEEGWYYSAEEVSEYLYTYGYLPGNFITKADARALGWEGGSVERYAPGCAIGGDVFGNKEGLLPKEKGRTYYECDIDTNGQNSRGAKRLVFSNDGLIYYTEDHYESFELLYGED
jgi:guanyl-specific ribonuclease Sa